MKLIGRSHLAVREEVGSAVSQREMEERARVRLRLAEKEWACGLGLLARPRAQDEQATRGNQKKS